MPYSLCLSVIEVTLEYEMHCQSTSNPMYIDCRSRIERCAHLDVLLPSSAPVPTLSRELLYRVRQIQLRVYLVLVFPGSLPYGAQSQTTLSEGALGRLAQWRLAS
jgi:hypothetical protein